MKRLNSDSRLLGQFAQIEGFIPGEVNIKSIDVEKDQISTGEPFRIDIEACCVCSASNKDLCKDCNQPNTAVGLEKLNTQFDGIFSLWSYPLFNALLDAANMDTIVVKIIGSINETMQLNECESFNFSTTIEEKGKYRIVAGSNKSEVITVQ